MTSDINDVMDILSELEESERKSKSLNKMIKVSLNFLNQHKMFKGGYYRDQFNNLAMHFYSSFLFTDVDGKDVYDTYYKCKRHHDTILFDNGYETLEEAGFNSSKFKKHIDMPTSRLVTGVMLLKLCPVCLRFDQYDEKMFYRFGGGKYDKVLVYPLHGDLMYIPVYDRDELMTIEYALKEYMGVNDEYMDIKFYKRSLNSGHLDSKYLKLLDDNDKAVLNVITYSKSNPEVKKRYSKQTKVYITHTTQGALFTASQVLRLLKQKKVKYVDSLLDVYSRINEIDIKVENWKMSDYYHNLLPKELIGSIFGGQIVKYSDVVDSGAYLRDIMNILDIQKRKIKTVTIRNKKGELISVLSVEGNTVIRTFDRHGTYITPKLFSKILSKVKSRKDLYVYRDVAYPNAAYFKEAGLEYVRDLEDSVKTWHRVGKLSHTNTNFVSPMIDKVSFEEIEETGMNDDSIAYSYEDYPLEIWKLKS